MQDAIDKRNERDRIAHSIVKRWNVHYMSEQEIEEARKKQQDEKRAQEILDRLAREAAEEEEKKQREIDAAVRQQIAEERARLQEQEAGVTEDKISAIFEDKETEAAPETAAGPETEAVPEMEASAGAEETTAEPDNG